jgi:hypothetical protein
MGMRDFLLSLVLAKDRKTLELWLIAIEMVSGIGGLLLLFLLLLLGFENSDLLLEVKFGFFAVVLAIGLGTLAVLQLLLAMEWNTRKK